MARRIPTSGNVPGALGTNTNTYIGVKETFLDRNAKLIPSDETTTALTNMNWIAGHHTVSDLTALYNIPDFILSQETYADKIGNGMDALGQLWYVESESCIYMLINWNNRKNSNGWSKTNVKSIKDPNGKDTTQYCNKDNVYDNLHNLTLKGDNTISYTGWTQGFKYTNNANTVTLSYTHYVGSDSSINIPVLNNGTTINQTGGNASTAGVMTADQYNKLVDRITKLEKECIWKSALAGNGSTYLWSGSLSDFNALTSKPTNTTFIITN